MGRGGFMQDLHWSVVDSAIAHTFVDGNADDPAPSVVLHAQDDPWTMSLFPHEFEALYTVSSCCLVRHTLYLRT